MIKYLRTVRTFEDALIADGLARFPTDGVAGEPCVYGGAFEPGADFDKLIQAYLEGTLLGFCGLWFPESSVIRLDGPLRAHLGAVMQLVDTKCRFVSDALSTEWSKHYGFDSTVGGHPGWLAREGSTGWALPDRDHDGQSLTIWEKLDFQGDCVVAHNNIGVAIGAALVGKPCVLYCSHEWGQGSTTHKVEFTPLVRFAAEYGLQQNLAYSEEEVAAKKKTVEPVSKAIVEAAQNKARETLNRMLAVRQEKRAMQNDPASILAAAGIEGVSYSIRSTATGGITVPQQGGPRELVVGTVFDPATHYTSEYFGGNAGLLYTQPDGTKNIYHGPAAEWQGFATAAKMMSLVIPKMTSSTLLDIGCGPGAFVGHALKAGVDAYGVDISSDAFAAAHPDVKDRLVCGDVTKSWMPQDFPQQFDIVTALDFWEHIFEPEIDPLIDGVKGTLKPGGIGFFIVCSRGGKEPDWTIKRGDTFTPQNSWLIASGHVTIRRNMWWLKKFLQHGFVPRHDLANMFQILREEDPGFAGVLSWGSKNLVVVEKRED